VEKLAPKTSFVRDTLQLLGACAAAVALVVGLIWYASTHPNTDLLFSDFWAVGSVPIVFGLLLSQFRKYLRAWRFWLLYSCTVAIHITLYARFVAGSTLNAPPLMALAFAEYFVLVTVFWFAIGPASKP
jgi:hypothetical protein